MPEISQQDTDIMNYLSAWTYDTLLYGRYHNKSKHRQCGVKPRDLHCLVLLYSVP